MDIDELLIHTTIRIEADLGNGIQSTGTGFFYTFFDDEKIQVPCIITNKHVVNGAKCLKLRFSLSENGKLTNKQFIFELNNLENFIINHPDNSIDLCIVLIASLLDFFKDKKESLYYTTLTNKDIPDEKYIQDKVSNIEDITVIGYPDGIWDFANNLPIVRKGITATPYFVNFNGEQKFLGDIACYPGSSGSPVIILQEGFAKDRYGNVKIGMGSKVFLLGINSSVYLNSVTGNIVEATDSETNKLKTHIEIPNNLAIIIKSENLLDFEVIVRQIIEKQSNAS